MRTITTILLAASFIQCAVPTHAAMVVRAGQFSPGPVNIGDDIDLRIWIDGDSTVPGDQLVPGGLLTAALRLAFPRSFLVTDIIPKAQLDHLESGQYAIRDLDPNTPTIGFSGNTQREVPPQRGYTGNLLAYIPMTATTPGTFDLTLTFFDPSANNNFIDGSGTILDAQIAFESASITVVPEPAAFALICAAGLLLTWRPHCLPSGNAA
jgi:hypothetical protein